MRKSLSRVACVQVIYSLELLQSLESYKSFNEAELEAEVNKALANSKEFLKDDELGKDNLRFANSLSFKIVSGVINFIDKIDSDIAQNIGENWEYKNIPPLLKAILRCGCFEIIAEKDTSEALILSEYLKITDEFFDRDEPAFVNACLDKIAKNYR